MKNIHFEFLLQIEVLIINYHNIAYLKKLIKIVKIFNSINFIYR